MQARTGARAEEIASLLESFGMELSAGGLVVMSDFAKAESAYIHHSRVPVAVVAMALVDGARGVAPEEGVEFVAGDDVDQVRRKHRRSPRSFWQAFDACPAYRR